MSKPNITITVSWIKNVYLRRLALILSLPFCVFISVGQGAILTLLVIVFEPIRRAIEVCSVLAGLIPTFKEQWAAKAEGSQS